MKVVGFFREAAGGPTVAQQNKAFQDYCRRMHCEPCDTFAEMASANGDVPAFRGLVRYLRAAAPEEVVVVLGAADALGTLRRDALLRCLQLQQLGASVTTDDGTAVDARALLDAWLRDDDAESISDRVRTAMRRKAVKGEVLGRPPYGYKVGSRRRLELIPEEAVVVRYIFRLYLREELGIRLIARRLNEEGLKTRRGGNWSMVSIRDILRNRAYLGTYNRFGMRVPGSHPSLVSDADFRQVQDRLNARRTSYAPRVASQFLLSGLADCGYCGNKLIGVSRRQSWKRRDGQPMSNSYRYYQCESRTNQSVCGYHTRRAPALEAEVHAALAAAMAEAPERRAASPAPPNRSIDRLRARARAIDRRFEASVADAARGRLSKEQLYELAERAATESLAAADAIDEGDRRAHRADPSAWRDDRQRLVEQWAELPFEERQSLLREAVSNITVRDDHVRVVLRG